MNHHCQHLALRLSASRTAGQSVSVILVPPPRPRTGQQYRESRTRKLRHHAAESPDRIMCLKICEVPRSHGSGHRAGGRACPLPASTDLGRPRSPGPWKPLPTPLGWEERPPAPEDRASAAHAGFIIYKLLSPLWSNPLERVFNISETDKPSIAQADSQS